jgi:RNA recognition motif-containing protein
MKKLFIGSLAWATKDDSLRAFFEQYGTVASATVVTERDNPNRSRGFGFVEFENDADADRAIAEADGKELDGRNITVSEAQSKERADS